MTNRTCTIDDCTRPIYCVGVCRIHYFRAYREKRRSLNPPKMKPTAAELFWQKVNKNGPTPEHRLELGPCWVWTGATTHLGYGVIVIAQVRHAAYRWAYEQEHGPIPEGLEPDHLCVNPPCVRPSHLEPVTHQENIRRGKTNGAPPGYCKRGHQLTEETTFVGSNGATVCRMCKNQLQRDNRARLKGN